MNKPDWPAIKTSFNYRQLWTKPNRISPTVNLLSMPITIWLRQLIQFQQAWTTMLLYSKPSRMQMRMSLLHNKLSTRQQASMTPWTIHFRLLKMLQISGQSIRPCMVHSSKPRHLMIRTETSTLLPSPMIQTTCLKGTVTLGAILALLSRTSSRRSLMAAMWAPSSLV